MPQIFRLHVRPTRDSVSKHASFDHCLANGVLGLGWPLQHPTERTIDWNAYSTEAKVLYGSDHAISRVRYLHDRVKPDDLIWTRTLANEYYLARVLEPWRYDDSGVAYHADMTNVVRCDFVKVGEADRVAGKVIACFRPTRAIQAITDPTAVRFSQLTWNQLSNTNHYEVGKTTNDLFALIDDHATEDLVLLWLQLNGWLLLASTRRTDTLAYEVVLVQKDSGKGAIVQIKTGNEKVNTQDWGGRETSVFLFQAQGRYLTEPPPGVSCIVPAEIIRMITEHPELIPESVSRWYPLWSGRPTAA